ncbi:MAG TPA: DUF4389 domain-containing protein [Gammaproteobacteria bacterium]|nr:DUF4389 domain-containing protein [Gammaproteobacteria bacterium]
MDSEAKEEMTPQEAWMRGLFMVMFFILLQLAKLVAGMVVVLQFLFTIFTNQTNDNLLHFGASLSRYIYQIWLYLTYNTETQPFPFAAWPDTPAAIEAEKALAEEAPRQAGAGEDAAGRRPTGKD